MSREARSPTRGTSCGLARTCPKTRSSWHMRNIRLDAGKASPIPSDNLRLNANKKSPRGSHFSNRFSRHLGNLRRRADFPNPSRYDEPMHLLGISAFYHDSAACLLSNGEIVAAASEERFSRKKHDSGFPNRAIQYCLDTQGITAQDLDVHHVSI